MSIPLPSRFSPSGFRGAPALAITVLTACGSTGHGHVEPLPDASDSGTCPTALVAQLHASLWAFTGSVTALRQSTEPPPPDGINPAWDVNKMAIVRISDVAMEPDELPLLTNELDTIQFQDAPTFDVGYAGHFLVSEFVDGQSHVFWEQGHLDASSIANDHFDTWVKAAQQYNTSEDLYQRMIGAQAVALVTVLDASEIPGQPIVDNGSDWWQAHVTVQAILRGTLPSGTIPVRFDGSEDFCCYLSPKLAVGDQAIVLLYPDLISGLPGTSYVISQPSDRQPMASQAQLAALLATPPTCPPLPSE